MIPQPKDYTPSIPYLVFLREAIKGGYKPSREEKAMLRKHSLRTRKNHPKAGFQTKLNPKLVEAD